MKHVPPAEESSMEEILASIRQIISSETKDEKKAPPRSRREEDILDLTDILPEEKTSQRGETPRSVPKREQPRDVRSEKAPVDKIDIYNLLDEAKIPSHRSSPSRRQGGESVEALVRELIRPQIKTWLDSNLPNLVRNVIHEEVENIIRQIGRGKK